MNRHMPLQSLRALVASMRPFDSLPFGSLDDAEMHKEIRKRGQVIMPKPGSLYFVLSGRATHVQQAPNGKVTHLHVFEMGDTVGWWPVEGCIEHTIETHYAVIPGAWASLPALLPIRYRMACAHVAALNNKLSVWAGCNVAERIALEPQKRWESISDVARRVGCSREMASRVLAGKRQPCESDQDEHA
jgi:hypothetical protein